MCMAQAKLRRRGVVVVGGGGCGGSARAGASGRAYFSAETPELDGAQPVYQVRDVPCCVAGLGRRGVTCRCDRHRPSERRENARIKSRSLFHPATNSTARIHPFISRLKHQDRSAQLPPAATPTQHSCRSDFSAPTAPSHHVAAGWQHQHVPEVLWPCGERECTRQRMGWTSAALACAACPQGGPCTEALHPHHPCLRRSTPCTSW